MTSETHVNILNLGYLGVLVPDLAAWMKFGTEILGAEMSMSEDGTTGYMKIDGREWRVALHPGERGNVAYLGFEVQGPQELSHAEHVLKDHQIDFERIGGAEAGERRVAELIRLRDPNGNLVELFYGHNNDYSFRSPLGVSRFVTGDQGLGHAVVGFKISDLAQQGRSRTVFMRCGPREHTLAVFEVPPGRAPMLHHFMLEVGELDDVGQAYDRVLDAEVPTAMTLGRHTNDAMVSFYCKTPAGFQLEYGWQGLRMSPSDAATTMTKGEYWGHRSTSSGKSINEALRPKTT